MEVIPVNAYGIIAKKRDGAPLDDRELRFLVDGYLASRIPDCQMAAFLMATAIRGMTFDETVALTRIMVESGRVLDLGAAPGPPVDKHSTGGVGDKISIPLVPIAAACGLSVPMISGRALGHTGGTLDKLESIPGMKTNLTPAEMARRVGEFGACFGGHSEEIAPADRAIYALRDATATVESVPLIVSSILSKKFAEGIRGVVIDVKCGGGAFMRTLPAARELAAALEAVGEALGLGVKTVVTSMDEPIGAAVGNALEIEESIHILEGAGPPDSTMLTMRLASEMLVLGGLARDVAEGEPAVLRSVESGRAAERFRRLVEAQGGRLDWNEEHYGLPAARIVRPFESGSSGFIGGIDARIVGETVREMGGGRFLPSDTIDPSVAIVFFKKRGDEVARGEPLCAVHASGEDSAQRALSRLSEAISITAERPVPVSLFLS
jgi:pyrimidine-nucleoside phosphorylase